MRDRGEQDRDHQPQKLINIESHPTAGFPDSIKQACAGDDEKERHHPAGGKNVPDLYPDKSVDILNMPIFQIKKSAAVINEYGQNGQNAQPVEFIFSS